MMRIVPLAATLAALLVGLAAPASQATFLGRNGVVAGGWRSDTNVWDETVGGVVGVVVRGIRAFGEPGGLLTGCEVSSPLPAELRACSERTLISPSFSADGTQLSFSTWWEIGIADLADDTVRYLPRPGARTLLSSSAFSPDGRQIAFAAGRDTPKIWISATDGSRVVPLTAGSSPDWSSTGWLAFSRRGQIYRVRPDGRNLRQLTRRGGLSPSWAPGGRKLAFLRGSRYATTGPRRLLSDGGVFVLDVSTGRLVHEVRETRDLQSFTSEVRWSPDGKQFAILGGALWRWDRSTASVIGRTDDIEYAGAEQTYSLNGIAWQSLPR